MMIKPLTATVRYTKAPLHCSVTKVLERWTHSSFGRQHLNPETRMLKQVEIEDARMASGCNRDADGNGCTAAS